MKRKYDAIVIGAGLSGLSCAYCLAKEGYSVCVLEKEHILGGAFQSFTRGGLRFDTGFHFVGGVGEGEIMHPLISYFGLENLPWKRLDSDRFADVCIRGKEYHFHSGYDAFQEELIHQFPDDEQGIREFMDVMRYISEHLYESTNPQWNIFDEKYFSISAYDFLQEHIQSPLLRDVLCGCSITTELTEDLPLYSFVQSLNSFVQGSYKLQGGGQVLIDALAENVCSAGGEIFTNMNVQSFVLDADGKATAVVCDNATLEADFFVSTIHPSLTVAMMPETLNIRSIYRRRMGNLQNTFGMFTVQLQIKPNTVPYMNRAICVYNSDDLWHTNYGKNSHVQTMLIHYSAPAEGENVRAIDLLTPMDWSAVCEWEDSRIGKRPEAYKQFKERKAKECIALAKQYVPHLEENIEKIWISTPLTYRDYTGTVHGSAYGVRKSSRSLMTTILSPATPIKNIFLSGQNMTLHGMLGVLITTIRVCGQITGKKIIL
ncbi:MAG: NAD(P)/FAD-dependent oxidoreductase [Bacteroidales bacterium]|nr:NAD(P)/FAD-dependent oxidoreductase [Bacteroidales bacterium]